MGEAVRQLEEQINNNEMLLIEYGESKKILQNLEMLYKAKMAIREATR